MGSRVERASVIESGSPLIHHNLNQERLRTANYSKVRNPIPKRVLRARMKREREYKEMLDWEDEKKNRIWVRVVRALEGYDGADCNVFRSEIAFVVSRGITAEKNI